VAPVDPQVQQQIETRESARVSKLFANSGAQASPSAAAGSALRQASTATPTLGSAAASAAPAADPSARQNGQDHKLAFIDAATGNAAASAERLQPPASPYIVQAGTVIAGALVTGIRSDLPGEITGQVTQDVYDSPTGRYLLIPQGSRLIGAYDSQVAFGQSRVLMVWTRLILPNGKSMALERQSGADPQGFAGLQDKVDDHWGQLLKGALLSTLLSVGAEAGTSSDENNLAQALRAGASQSISQTGEQIVARDLNVQPTLTIRPGFPVTVVVGRDLVLEPYGA
jgi:type IV secretion system protein VirB10